MITPKGDEIGFNEVILPDGTMLLEGGVQFIGRLILSREALEKGPAAKEEAKKELKKQAIRAIQKAALDAWRSETRSPAPERMRIIVTPLLGDGEAFYLVSPPTYARLQEQWLGKERAALDEKLIQQADMCVGFGTRYGGYNCCIACDRGERCKELTGDVDA